MFKTKIEGLSGYIYGNGPVQGYGKIDGYPWYFRARHDFWHMEITDVKDMEPEDLPIVGDAYSGWEISENWGKGHEASYMPESVALALIESVVEKFRSGQLTFVEYMPE